MSTPAELVGETFSNARTLADNSLTLTETFTNALANAVYTAPTFDLTWTPVAAPSALSIPSAPTLPDPGSWDAGTAPSAFSATAPDLTIDDFTVAAPVLTFPDAPVLSYGDMPVIPAVGDVVVPDAPSIVLPSEPSYLSLSTPTFAGIDLHADFLTNLETIPTLDLVAPTPYTYSPGPKYASTLLSTLQTVLTSRLAGGTGLAPAVEQAIWDRARSRETKLAAANELEVTRRGEALGYHLPPGIIAQQLRQAQQDSFDKVSGLSRDIAIKQADLEQANLKDAIATGMDLEGKLVDYSFRLEDLAFNTAKTVAENALAIYNGALEKYKALLDSYRTYAAAYDTIIKGELAKVEVYRAEIAGEQAKADTNRTLVMEYQAQVEARLSLVKVYEAQVGGAKALIELEGVKISAAGEQIKAWVAGVNGEVAKVEAYKAGVQGESAKAEAYGSQARAFAAKAGAQGDRARAQLGYYQAQAQAYTAQWDGYRAQSQAQAARFQAIASQSSMLVDGFKAELAATQAGVEQSAKLFEATFKQYEAQQNYSISVAKINTEVIQANRQATLEAAKAGAQVFSQLTASAYSMIHASAGVSASASDSVSYAYSNDTADAAPTVTAV